MGVDRQVGAHRHAHAETGPGRIGDGAPGASESGWPCRARRWSPCGLDAGERVPPASRIVAVLLEWPPRHPVREDVAATCDMAIPSRHRKDLTGPAAPDSVSDTWPWQPSGGGLLERSSRGGEVRSVSCKGVPMSAQSHRHPFESKRRGPTKSVAGVQPIALPIESQTTAGASGLVSVGRVCVTAHMAYMADPPDAGTGGARSAHLQPPTAALGARREHANER